MDADDRFGMVQGEEGRYPGAEVTAARTIAGISERGHQPVPALGHVSVVDANLGRARRKAISGQGRHDHVELFKHWQHVDIVEKTAGPAVCEDQRHAPAGCRALVNEMDAFPGEVVERIELPFPGPPIERISPVRYEVPQPVLLGALFPADTGYLIGPSGLAQPYPQIIEDLIRDMDLKRLHRLDRKLADGIGQNLGRLRPHQALLLRENETGNPSHAHAVGPLHFGIHRINIRTAFKFR